MFYFDNRYLKVVQEFNSIRIKKVGIKSITWPFFHSRVENSTNAFFFTREREMKAATAACVEQEGYCVRSCWRESILLLRRKRGRHFWAFLEKGAKGKEALSSICALETQLSSSYLLKILLGMLIRFAFLVFFFLVTFFWVWNENHFPNALSKNLKSLDLQ